MNPNLGYEYLGVNLSIKDYVLNHIKLRADVRISSVYLLNPHHIKWVLI